MKNNIIRLDEATLNKIVYESVKRVLKEGPSGCYGGGCNNLLAGEKLFNVWIKSANDDNWGGRILLSNVPKSYIDDRGEGFFKEIAKRQYNYDMSKIRIEFVPVNKYGLN